ncbi:MAG: FAD/NAD(P)-binding oxidoreductase [Treponema sp.]|nr:MAG: FAD/NAD(P)-binding oxidoreductase [Treponema sp.]
MSFDVIVIGCGVVGASIARELSKYDLSVAVLEKHLEPCSETSRANSGIVHGGYDTKLGTLKCELNIRGNRLIREEAERLDLDFHQTGSLVLAFSKEDEDSVSELYERGLAMNCEGLEIWDKDTVLENEPNISENVRSALYCGSAGIICPFDMTFSGIEVAVQNGARFVNNAEVLDIKKGRHGGYDVETSQGVFNAQYVVNAAGLFSDKIANMVGDYDFSILPRKGEYRILDKTCFSVVKRVIFQAPSKLGKGVLVSPTSHGNIIVGPTAQAVDSIYDTSITQEGLGFLDEKSIKSVPSLNLRKTIRVFSGVRAKTKTKDFIISESKHAQGFINVGGIDSPGLSSAFAIAEYVVSVLEDAGAKLVKKSKYNSSRKRIQKPDYGQIICRCESVTEQEIVEAVRRPAGAVTVDGIKRRVRPGSGRCQGGFCTPKVMQILSRELNTPMEEIVKGENESFLLIGKK